jgi:hypothetical protein
MAANPLASADKESGTLAVEGLAGFGAVPGSHPLMASPVLNALSSCSCFKMKRHLVYIYTAERYV